jgi:NAD(P)-dependent dehydrogenase (short-subunit alcohol dehydrogenase family)
MSKTFLITGVSTGLGRAIAERALEAGHTVAGTVRQSEQIAAFAALAPGRAHGYLLDVTDEAQVGPTVDRIEADLGPIDVLVVNAGFGLEGTFEETAMADVRRQFDVNVFGAIATMKAVLPGMRTRRSGHIFVITSMGGLTTFPGISFYHGTKWALEGIVDSLAQEVARFGVHVTAVAPGGFRTDWAGRSMSRAPRVVADYDELFGPIRENRLSNSGKQLGNPSKAGDAILALVEAEHPPVHVLLGSDAVRLVAAGRARVQRDLDDWAELAESTDFAEGRTIA